MKNTLNLSSDVVGNLLLEKITMKRASLEGDAENTTSVVISGNVKEAPQTLRKSC